MVSPPAPGLIAAPRSHPQPLSNREGGVSVKIFCLEEKGVYTSDLLPNPRLIIGSTDQPINQLLTPDSHHGIHFGGNKSWNDAGQYTGDNANANGKKENTKGNKDGHV